MLADQAHQRDEADLRVDVEARHQVDEDQRAEQRHRHRHQDHDRIAQAVELRGQREEHDDEREQQRRAETARFLHELARLARVVERVAGRRDFVERIAEELQRLALRHAARAGDRRRVELLETVDRLRHDIVLERCDRRCRDHRAVRRANVVVEHLIGIQPIGLQHLRYHLVRAAGDREVVDVAAAERGAERAADVLLRQAERRDEIAIDDHGGLRLVDLEVGVDEPELAAVLGLLQHRLRDFVEILRRLGRVDHDLDRRALRARQRRQLEREDLAAGDRAPLLPAAPAASTCAFLLRSSHGVNSMPPKPVPGVMIWNIISYSGSALPIANICCE